MNARARTAIPYPELKRTVASGELGGSSLRGIVHDSRQVQAGSVYVALCGAKVDGHNFIGDAAKRGAAVIVAERTDQIPAEFPYCKVPNARAALSELSSLHYGNPSASLQICGVTGTNGKTTVAYFLRQLLLGLGHPSGVLGTVAYAYGDREIPAIRTTPEAPVLHDIMDKMRRAGCTHVAMEVSSHALEQQRVADIDFDVAVFTNLSRDHLDYHGNMNNYFEAKAALFSMPAVKARVVNVDDAYGRLLAKKCGPENLLCYGVASDADLIASVRRAHALGTEGQLLYQGDSISFCLSTPGMHNVENLMAAVGAVLQLGHSLREVEPVIGQLQGAPGRLERVPSPRGTVYVDYAHSPDALWRVLKTLKPLAENRCKVVFGCGGDRDRGKRAPMVEAAAEQADELILTLDNPRKEKPEQILADMRAAVPDGVDAETIADRKEAIEHAIAGLQPGDVLLIAGKGHENAQEFAHQIVPFDDRQVARKAVEACWGVT